jgi:hypothetical protein
VDFAANRWLDSTCAKTNKTLCQGGGRTLQNYRPATPLAEEVFGYVWNAFDTGNLSP